ncbi:MAG TPA: ATP-binding protein, partial [Kofleriaceae bacterium]|nr:ATP-binding protein [Kofleriaceae bacterium]
ADPHRVVEIKSVRCQWRGAPGVIGFARDVTERKQIQRSLVAADRLSALGKLAAAVAHEINNPLTYVQLALQMLELHVGKLAGAAELSSHVHDARHGVDRVAAITSGLRRFARDGIASSAPDDPPPTAVDIVTVVTQSLKMVDNDLRHRAQLEFRAADVPAVFGTASRFEQVIVNVLINAIQSLHGDITRDRIAVAIERHGDEVAVIVRDNGCGVPVHLHERVFEPFFTTKSVGDGMGLGLAVSRSIVTGYGGRIELVDAHGGGTIVTLWLRVHHGSSRDLPQPWAPVAIERRRVLVVDDEPMVRQILLDLLAAHHQVEVAESGEAALAAIGRDKFDVILCDMMMPGVSGMDVYHRVARDHPGVERRIVFITGGTFVPDLTTFLASVDNRLLAKPFSLEQVLAAIAV